MFCESNGNIWQHRQKTHFDLLLALFGSKILVHGGQIILYENKLWTTHIDIISSKIAQFSGVLNRLKRFLPIYVLRTLYCSMVLSRLTYGILTWFFYHYRLDKIQNRIIRIITHSKYNAQTKPLFKALDLLTISDLFNLNCLKFVYKFKNKKLPLYFLDFECVPRSEIHDHGTRYAHLIDWNNSDSYGGEMHESSFSKYHQWNPQNYHGKDKLS